MPTWKGKEKAWDVYCLECRSKKALWLTQFVRRPRKWLPLPNWASFVPLRCLNALAFHAAAAAQIKPLFQTLSVSALSI